MSLVTTCPTCGTIFKVQHEQLNASNGWVRCGHCMNVFDAKSQFTSADLIDFKDTGLSNQTDSQLAEFSFVQTSKQQAFWSSLTVRSFLIVLSAVLVLLLILQVTRQHALSVQSKWPTLKPLLLSFCQKTGCELRAKRQIDGWLIDYSNFENAGSNQFNLTVQLKNISASALLTPSIELSLLGTSDVLKIRHVIAMPDSGSEDAVVLSGSERTFQFVIQPNALTSNGIPIRPEDVLGYRLVLFYP